MVKTSVRFDQGSGCRRGAVARAHIVHEITETAKGEDEKVDLLHQQPLARPVLHLEVFAKLGRRHHEVAASLRCARSEACVLVRPKQAWWCVYIPMFRWSRAAWFA